MIGTQQIPRTPGRKTLSFGAADLAKSFTFTDFPGMLISILYEQYNTDNNRTGTVEIIDENSFSLFSKAALADNANTLISVRTAESKDVPFLQGKTYTVTVTLSGAPGNAGNIYVTLVIV